MTAIKFGTDGWRSIIAEDFTFQNVRLVSQAIASYIKEAGMDKKGIVIGYDSRFLSEDFADAVAEIMAGNWIKSYLTAHVTPTPVVAFAVTEQDAAGAVMLTASHNPPRYHGIKFIPHYGGPAMPEVTDRIMELVHEKEKNGQVERMEGQEAERVGLIKKIQPQNSYLTHLQGLVDVQAIGQAKLKVVVDPMHGAGMGYLEKFLTFLGCPVHSINANRDAFFGNMLPDPSEDNLSSLKFKVRELEADLGLALDGDGDRLGVVDPAGNYFSPNQILFVVLRHLVKNRGWEGTVARTVATTHMLDRVAQEHGIKVEETPVGFKYIGDLMLRQGAFMGGEESGGISIKGHVPEKDGILGCLLILEILSREGKGLQEIIQDIYQEYGMLVSRRLDVHTTPQGKEKILQQLKGYTPTLLAGKKILETNFRDGWKYILEDGSWFLIRASGTEPVFRLYVEAPTLEEVLRMQREVKESLSLG